MNRRRFLSWLGALGLAPTLPKPPLPITWAPSQSVRWLGAIITNEQTGDLVATIDIEAMVKADIAQHMAYGIDRLFVDSVEFDT